MDSVRQDREQLSNARQVGNMNDLVKLEADPVNGELDSRFTPVADAFAQNFSKFGEIGAACAVYHRGKKLVDLWGGLADNTTGRPWTRDSVVLQFSAAKGVTATCINRLAERELLDLDAPIAEYWPEFGCNGKEAITARMVLSHRAGLAAVDGELTLEQVLRWDPVVDAIAKQAPNWEPDSAHGYHARSYGWILGELVRRVTDRSIGQYLAQEIAAPLGLRYWIGVPERELEHCARLIPPGMTADSIAALLGANELTKRVMSGPSGLFGYNEMWNRPEILAAEMPSSNGVGDARSLARLYAALLNELDGVRLLGTEQLRRACKTQSRGPDKVIFHDTAFGLGYSLQPMVAPGAGPNSFGHPGAGGAVGFADPDANLAFAYVTNTMHFNIEGDPRSIGLVNAVYDCLS